MVVSSVCGVLRWCQLSQVKIKLAASVILLERSLSRRRLCIFPKTREKVNHRTMVLQVEEYVGVMEQDRQFKPARVLRSSSWRA
jgi:hypothetical protein